MQSVFVAGSIKIKKLPSAFVERLDKLIASDLKVLVGDANGADKAVQQVLLDRGAASVTIYCTGQPRINLGDWPVVEVQSDAQPATRQYFAAKDMAMASVADFGLMLWDAKSTGTLSNVIELTREGKPSVVYVNPDSAFAIIKNAQNLRDLVDLMTPDARSVAESKIALTAKLSALESEQLDLLDQFQ